MNLTQGAEAKHPILVSLVNELNRQSDEDWPVETILTEFWTRVADAGTPLITPTVDGFRATFLWRETPDSKIDGVGVESELWRIPLMLLAGTDVWFVEVDLPEDLTATYYFWLEEGSKVIPNDVHEPWPLAFADEFNPCSTSQEDSIYPASVVSQQPEPGDFSTRDFGRTIMVPSKHLDLPREQQDEFPVWVYQPDGARKAAQSAIPTIILLNGQFLESSPAASVLRRGMRDGSIPNAVVVTSCAKQGPKEHSAWGWRNGYGPHDLSEFFSKELFPSMRSEVGEIGPVHLIAWSYTARAAIATALELQDSIASITLLGLENLSSDSVGWPPAQESDEIVNGVRQLLTGGKVSVAVSESTPRVDDFAWRDPSDKLLSDLGDAADQVKRIPLTDPNIVAAARSLPVAIRAAVL